MEPAYHEQINKLIAARLQDMLDDAKVIKAADKLAQAAEDALNCKPHAMHDLFLACEEYREVKGNANKL